MRHGANVIQRVNLYQRSYFDHTSNAAQVIHKNGKPFNTVLTVGFGTDVNATHTPNNDTDLLNHIA